MAATLSTAARNAACDAVVDLLDAGAGAGKLKLYTSGAVLLCTITLSDPAFGSSATGVATLAGTPLTGTASGAGTVDNATLTDSNDVVVMSGTLAAFGITIDNPVLAVSQQVSITSGTHTQPAS
jgi:hypothetical protein